jgi:hypothetical protein
LIHPLENALKKAPLTMTNNDVKYLLDIGGTDTSV